jgi:uncharacterized cupin superfamily protein
MPKPILNIADLQFRKVGHGTSYPGSTPGKRAWPFHNHHINEEMFFILEGEGEVRIGGETFPIRQGDVIAHPPGGPDTAHQIVNTSNAELKYLGVSTRLSAEICDYPDSKKFAVYGELSGPDGKPQFRRFVSREENSLNYWEGE